MGRPAIRNAHGTCARGWPSGRDDNNLSHQSASLFKVGFSLAGRGSSKGLGRESQNAGREATVPPSWATVLCQIRRYVWACHGAVMANVPLVHLLRNHPQVVTEIRLAVKSCSASRTTNATLCSQKSEKLRLQPRQILHEPGEIIKSSYFVNSGMISILAIQPHWQGRLCWACPCLRDKEPAQLAPWFKAMRRRTDCTSGSLSYSGRLVFFYLARVDDEALRRGPDVVEGVTGHER
jgi:hypothetical protein